MNSFKFSIAAAMVAVALENGAEPLDASSCGAMTIADQCRISWSFSRTSDSYYSVQRFDPVTAEWRTLTSLPPGTPSQGTRDSPVEAGYLYRVLACDDAEGKTNCSGSTMVWAPLIQPEEQAHLIPGLVLLDGTRDHSGKPLYAKVDKDDGWVGALIQYNVYLMVNAIARANTGDLPDMTPVNDIRFDPPDDPIEVVQFNVYWAYSGDQGKPLDSPMPEQVPRPPHEHPEWHLE